MYIMVQHTVSDPARFWGLAQQAVGALPEGITLHHTFANADGTRAVCVWEAASVETVRGLLEPSVGSISRNEYYQVPNKEGVTVPPAVQLA